MKKVSPFIAARSLARQKGWKAAKEILEESPQGAMYLSTRKQTIKRYLKALAPKKELTPHPLCRDLATYTCLPEWDHSKALILHGLSGRGKTILAISLIRTPLIVSQMEDLKTFSAKLHSGIIFDDCDWIKDLERYQQIHLVDLSLERTFPARFHNAKIPAHVPRIITTNLPTRELMPVYLEEIRRRTTCWCVINFNEFYVQW